MAQTPIRRVLGEILKVKLSEWAGNDTRTASFLALIRQHSCSFLLLSHVNDLPDSGPFFYWPRQTTPPTLYRSASLHWLIRMHSLCRYRNAGSFAFQRVIAPQAGPKKKWRALIRAMCSKNTGGLIRYKHVLNYQEQSKCFWNLRRDRRTGMKEQLLFNYGFNKSSE